MTEPGGLQLLGAAARSPLYAAITDATRDLEVPKLEVVAGDDALAQAAATIEHLLCWCPVTGQPDYYRVDIRYRPAGKVVESKSLKWYGEWFMTRAMFAESLAVTICADVADATGAHWVEVVVHQAVRGGIALSPIIARIEKEHP